MAHLTLSLYLCSSGSNAQSESRAQDGDEGVAGRNGRELCFPDEGFFTKRQKKIELGTRPGTDQRMKALTLRSIPKLRGFVNDTILDVLFYTRYDHHHFSFLFPPPT